MNKRVLKDASALAQIPIGYVQETRPVRASLWRLMLYAAASNDWNRVHINPLTAWRYKSNLGGMSYCGDLITAWAKAFFQKMFLFGTFPETIARGTDGVKFFAPVRVGMHIRFRWTLDERTISGTGKVRCIWKFEVIACDTEKILCSGLWNMVYAPVEFSFPGKVSREPALIMIGSAITANVVFGAYCTYSLIANHVPISQDLLLGWTT